MKARKLCFRWPLDDGQQELRGEFEHEEGGWLDRSTSRWYPDAQLMRVEGIDLGAEHKCPHCAYVAQNAQGLSAHVRHAHKKVAA